MPALSSSGEGSLTPRRFRSRQRTRHACGGLPEHEQEPARARLACRTGTRSASGREMPTTRERPARLASPGARRGPRTGHPTAGRRQVPAYPPAAADAPRRLLVVLLQELHNQPPPHVEVRLARNEGCEPGHAHRLVIHSHRVAKSCHLHPAADASQLQPRPTTPADARRTGPQARGSSRAGVVSVLHREFGGRSTAPGCWDRTRCRHRASRRCTYAGSFPRHAIFIVQREPLQTGERAWPASNP